MKQEYGGLVDWLLCLLVIVITSLRVPRLSRRSGRDVARSDATAGSSLPERRDKSTGVNHQRKFDTALFVAILGSLPTPLVALLQWNGVVSVNWKLSVLGYGLLISLALWAFWKWEGASRWRPTRRYVGAATILLLLAGASVAGVVNQYRREHSISPAIDKPALEASFFVLDPWNTPLREITVPREQDTVTVDLSPFNSGKRNAHHVTLWYRICDQCQYTNEPEGALRANGASEFDRQFDIQEIAAGSLGEKISVTIRVPPTLEHFWLGMFYTCDDCAPVDAKHPQMLRVHIAPKADQNGESELVFVNTQLAKESLPSERSCLIVTIKNIGNRTASARLEGFLLTRSTKHPPEEPKADAADFAPGVPTRWRACLPSSGSPPLGIKLRLDYLNAGKKRSKCLDGVWDYSVNMLTAHIAGECPIGRRFP